MKLLFTEKKGLYFKESITFQTKYHQLQKYYINPKGFIYLKESIILNRKFYFFKRKHCN